MSNDDLKAPVATKCVAVYAFIAFIPSWVLGLTGILLVGCSRSIVRLNRTRKRWHNPLRWIFAPVVLIGGALNGLVRVINKPFEIVYELNYISGEKLQDEVDNNPKVFKFYALTLAVIAYSFDDAESYFIKKKN